MNNSVSFPIAVPVVDGALDLSDPNVSVLCQFRRADSQTNIFSVYAQKITVPPPVTNPPTPPSPGKEGGVYLTWPFFSTDIDIGNYEIECIVFWGVRNQTCYDRIPIWINEQFGPGALIADDQNASWIGGNIYIRNTDTGSVHGLSISGTISVITLADGVAVNTLPNAYPMPPTYTQNNNSSQLSTNPTSYPPSPWPGPYVRPTQPVSLVSVRVVDGQLFFLNPTDNYWHRMYLSGSPSKFTIDPAILTMDSSGADIISVATRAGKFLMKNLDDQTWHEITITGQPGSENLTVGGAI